MVITKKDIHFPVTFQEYQYTRLRAFLSASLGPFLISADFKAELEKHGITGWKTFPIRLLDKKGVEMPGYEGFSITGRCGPRDRSKATLVEKENRYGKFYYHKGVFLDLNTWDGSDIFIERYYWTEMISPKAAEVFKKQNALQLMPLSEVEVDISDYKWMYSKYELPSDPSNTPA